jgi:hypothetical protein
MPVLPLRQLEILYYFYIEIYIEIEKCLKLLSFEQPSRIRPQRHSIFAVGQAFRGTLSIPLPPPCPPTERVQAFRGTHNRARPPVSVSIPSLCHARTYRFVIRNSEKNEKKTL